jgi:tetratricopeptide (TPR) repeat protein
MKKHIGAYACAVLIGLCISPRFLHADQCDDLFAKAHGVFESAREATKQNNYDSAAELYQEAAAYYGQVATMQNCRCPTIAGTSQRNANLSRELAKKYQERAKDYATEKKLYEDYNKAMEKYKEGDTYARNREWDKAIAAFEEAARIWDGVSTATQSENGKKAAKAAQQARDAANLARQYRQKQ